MLTTVDLSNSDHVLQIEGQLRPGAHVWFNLPSLSSKPAFANKHGSQGKARSNRRKSKASEVIRHALHVAAKVLSDGGHVSFVRPVNDEVWHTSEWNQFEGGFHLFRSYFRGPLRDTGTGHSGLQRWAVSTTSLRILQLFGQHDLECDMQAEAEDQHIGSAFESFECTANFANLGIESYFPEKFYRSVPAMCATNALVTRNLSRSEWLKDVQGVSSVQKEAEGLRNNQTWDDDSVQHLWQLKKESRETGQKIKVAELLTLCGIKHFELGPQHHRYKGRIVYRGDYVTDASGHQVYFEDTSTTPTGLVGLG